MRPASLLFILLATAGFVPSGTITVRLEGDGKLVAERMVIRGPDGKPTYKAASGNARITGTISVDNGLTLPVTALRVRLQLRTKSGEAPRAGSATGSATIDTPPSTFVDYKLKQPLAPGEMIKLPLNASLYVSYDHKSKYANPFMPTDEQLAKASVASLDIEEATIGPREVALQPEPLPPPPPAQPGEYESYINRLDRELTVTLARPVTVTATLVARRNETSSLRRDADAPQRPEPLVYRLLVKRDIPVIARNTGATSVRHVSIAVEDIHHWWPTSLSQSPVTPKPPLAPGEERELTAKLDHLYRLGSEIVPESLPLPLAGRNSARAAAAPPPAAKR